MKKTNFNAIASAFVIVMLLVGITTSCNKKDDSDELGVVSSQGSEAYHCGLDLLKDETKHSAAFEKIKEASEAGFDSARVMLAKMYEYGIGTDQDFKMATDIYSQMSKTGNEFAVNKLNSINKYNCRIETPKDIILSLSNTFVLCDSMYGLPNGDGTFKTDANSIRVVNSDKKLIYMSYRHPRQPETEIVNMNSNETAITLVMCCIPYSFNNIDYDFFVSYKDEIAKLSCTKELAAYLDELISHKGYFDLSEVFPELEKVFAFLESEGDNNSIRINSKASICEFPTISDGDYSLSFDAGLANKSQIKTRLFDDTKYEKDANCWNTHFRVINESSYPLSWLPGKYDLATKQFDCKYKNDFEVTKKIVANIVPPSDASDFRIGKNGVKFISGLYFYSIKPDVSNSQIPVNDYAHLSSYVARIQQAYNDAHQNIANSRNYKAQISSNNNAIKYYFPGDDGALFGYYCFYQLYEVVHLAFAYDKSTTSSFEAVERFSELMGDATYFPIVMSLFTDNPQWFDFAEKTIENIISSMDWKKVPIVKSAISWYDCFTSDEEHNWIVAGGMCAAEEIPEIVSDFVKSVGGYNFIADIARECSNIASQIVTRSDKSFVIPFISNAFYDNPIAPDDPTISPEEENITISISIGDRRNIPNNTSLTYDYGQNLTFTATVTPSNHSITIYDGGTKKDLKNGFNINSLSVGLHKINVYVDYDPATKKGKKSCIINIEIKEKQEELKAPEITSCSVDGSRVTNGGSVKVKKGETIKINANTNISCEKITGVIDGVSSYVNNSSSFDASYYCNETGSRQYKITATNANKTATFTFNVVVEDNSPAPQITSVKVNGSSVSNGKTKYFDYGDDVQIEVKTDIVCDEISVDFPDYNTKSANGKDAYKTPWFDATESGTVTITATKNGKTAQFVFYIDVEEKPVVVAPEITSADITSSSIRVGDGVYIDFETSEKCDVDVYIDGILKEEFNRTSGDRYKLPTDKAKQYTVKLVAKSLQDPSKTNSVTKRYTVEERKYSIVDAGGLPNNGAQTAAHNYWLCNDLVFQSADKANFEGSFWVYSNGQDEYNTLYVSKKSGTFSSKEIRLIVSTSITDLRDSNIIDQKKFQGGEKEYSIDIKPTSKQLYLIVYVGGGDCGSMAIDGYYCGPFYYESAE